MNATLTGTIPGDGVLPGRTLARDAFMVLAGSLGLAILAQVAVPLPFSPVPVTGQTFGVLLAGLALGSRTGSLAVLLYLLEGAAGLPFFAGGAGGILFVGGPTGGYLLAFPVAAFVAGRLTERRGANPAWTFAAMLAGHAVIYAMGAGWLAAWMEARGMNPGIGGVLGAGVWPFLPGDGVKALAAAALVPGARRVYDECQ